MITPVPIEATLSSGLGSNVDELIVAETATALPAVHGHLRATMKEIGAVSPEAIDALAQDAVPALPTAGVVHVQPFGVPIDPKVEPEGMAWLTTTPFAGKGPALVAVKV